MLCWKMDRLARNPYDSGRHPSGSGRRKLERIITSDGVKTANGNDRLMGTFELAIATKFIDDLRANVKRGNRARFEKGWPNYLPPLGYLNDPATEDHRSRTTNASPSCGRCGTLCSGATRPKDIAPHAGGEWNLRTVHGVARLAAIR